MWCGIEGGVKNTNSPFLGSFLNCSNELKKNHAHVFILYFWGSRTGEPDIVISGIMVLIFFIYLVVWVFKEESSKKKWAELGRVCWWFAFLFSWGFQSTLIISCLKSVIEPCLENRIIRNTVFLCKYCNFLISLSLVDHATAPTVHDLRMRVSGDFFCQFYIFIFYFWCIFNKLGFACHRAIAIKKCQGIPFWDWCLCFLIRCLWSNMMQHCSKMC